MNDSNFPRPIDAPDTLRSITANCGPISAWQVLKFFGKNVSPDELLQSCRFDPVVGVYAIGLAVALADIGLTVTFYSDPDPDPSLVEREFYSQARRLALDLRPGAGLPDLDAAMASALHERGVGIILYETEGEDAHFTPFLGLCDDEIVAPNEGDGLLIDDVELRRAAKGILRQALIIRPPPDAP